MPLNTIPNKGLTSRGYPSDRLVTPIIINGDMSVAQRGTSTSGLTSNAYGSVDRFHDIINGSGTWTSSQVTDAPTGQGFVKAKKMNCTTADSSLAAGDYLFINQKIEGQNLQSLKKGTSNAEAVTIAFWVKSNKTGTYILELYDADNSRRISNSYSISSANTWEKKILNFAGDTTGAFDNDNGGSLQVNFWLAAGSSYSSGTLGTTWAANTNANRAVGQVNLADSTSNEWYITGVQLEVGEFDSTTIPSFPFESYASNLQRCQRYFYQIQGNDSANTLLGIGFNNDASSCQTYLKFPTTMRSTPSITSSSGLQTSDGNSYTKAATGVSVDSGSNIQMSLNIAASGLTVFRGGFNTLTNSSSSHLALSSEL